MRFAPGKQVCSDAASLCPGPPDKRKRPVAAATLLTMLDADLGLNLLLRGSAAGVLVLIAAVLWRERSCGNAIRLGAMFSGSLAAATLASAPGLSEAPPAWRFLVSALSPGSMFLFWLLTRALFDDAFVPRPWHSAAWMALAGAGVASCMAGASSGPAPWVWALRMLLGISPVAWASLSIASSLASWREDLIERRRRWRSVVVATTTLYTVAQLLVALLSGLGLRAVVESTANAGGIAALTLFVGWRLLRQRDDAVFELVALDVAATPAAQHVRADQGPGAADPPVSLPAPPDARQVAALESLMSVDHLYREPSLSIGALASRMDLPEHKLRRLINTGLGHRNFSAFLNSYRLADARRWLADPTQRDTPILTIAMDAGFQSLGPFNRAFKDATGVTPSEFRRLGGRVPPCAPGSELAESEIG